MITLVVHELRRAWRTPAVWLTLTCLSALLAYAAARGLASSRSRAEAQRKTVERVALERAGLSDAYAVGALGVVVALEPRDAAALSLGHADLAPDTRVVTIASTSKRRDDRYELESPLTLAAGRFDVAFVIVYLAPLAVIALSFAMLGEERDEGTLGLLVSHPIDPATVVAAKASARFVVSGLPIVVVPPGVLWFLDAGLSGESTIAYEFVALSYVAMWVAVAALVAVHVQTSARAAVALVVTWLVLALVAPPAAEAVTERVVPAPSRLALVEATRSDDVRDLDGQALLKRWHGDHPELSEDGGAGWQQRSVLVQRETMRRMRPLEREFARAFEEQERIASVLRLLSPTSSARHAFDVLAGTDAARYRSFRAAVDDWAPSWNDWFTPYIQNHRPVTQAVPELAVADTRNGSGLWLALISFATIIVCCTLGIAHRLRRAPLAELIAADELG